MSDWSKLSVEQVDRKHPPLAIYRLRGGLTSNEMSYEFLERVRSGVRKGPNRVVINLEGMEHLSSAGLGILAACYTSIVNAGGKLCLASIPKRAEMILGVVHFLDVVESAASEEEAIRKVTA
ncbi:MAG: STAS domain-containing protein [Candidatus Eisenbacteria bacterium]|nr:STAS domain-containing protein [Candidatus Eisenbacteria bacterium]